MVVHVMDLLLTWRWSWSWSRIMGYIKHISWTLKNNLCYYEMMIKIKNRFFSTALLYVFCFAMLQVCLLTFDLTLAKKEKKYWILENAKLQLSSTHSSVGYYWYIEKKKDNCDMEYGYNMYTVHMYCNVGNASNAGSLLGLIVLHGIEI